jgi:two-component system, OmpR family, sensor kinase
MNRLTLRGRLVTTTVLASLGAVGVLVVGLHLLLAHIATSDSLAVLRGRADAVATTVRGTPDRVHILDNPSDSLDQNIWIFDVRGKLLDGRTPRSALAPVVDALSAARAEHVRVVREQYRLLARPVRVNGRGPVVAVVVAGIDLTPYESSERRGLVLSLALGLLSVVAAGAASWAAAGYSLRQVRRMARAADDWREHDLHGRFDLGRPKDELGELGDTLDRMLDRIARAILAERRLTDEVAHELRTPLSVIRTEAQLALLGGDLSADREEALNAIVEATARMNQSISTMLAVARSAHAGDNDECRAADVLEQVRAHAAARDGVSFVTDMPDAALTIAAPAQVVVAALSPIADNAVRHARSTVRLSAHAERRRVLLSIEDDGDGVDEEDREAIFTPGHSSTEDGAGLGLALARRLAHSVGAEIHERGNGHGLFVVDFPRP